MNYLFTFLEGLASFISPCILPLVPIYISFFSGVENPSTKKAFINSLFFVLGFSIIFILMGLFASTLGVFISSNMKYIKIVFGIIMILLGIAYMDIIKLPVFLNLNIKSKINLKELNPIRSFLFGILFSISHTPCVGLFLSSALMLVTKEQDILNGLILMILYSLGLGLPFIISALIVDKLKNTFDFIKKHFKVVKIISGIVLIVMGILMIFVL